MVYANSLTCLNDYWGINSTNGSISNNWVISGNGSYQSPAGTSINIDEKDPYREKGVNPVLVFKFWKKNLTAFGNQKYKARINKLKKLAFNYIKLGHNALGKKLLAKLTEETRFCEMYGAGIKYYIKASLIYKYKHKVRGGHISDTLFKNYTKVIPKDILEKKRKLEKLKIFDDYVIYHYWNEKLEKKKEKKEEIKSSEEAAMRDPILFGICKDIPDKLFFIDEWDDDYCDLTFDELIDGLDVEEEDMKIGPNPKMLNEKT